ncbi:hypothetical protein ACWEQ7_16260 [Streptomyces sp. NPDC004069]|uniref:hypothetical protein n=1 Tax=Streptomyces sp. NPDC052043 TaxID=3365684 RepID=UPI0037D53422
MRRSTLHATAEAAALLLLGRAAPHDGADRGEDATPAGPGRSACHGIRRWTVTVRVTGS